MSEPEKMRARFPWVSPLSDSRPDLELLTPDDVRYLRLPWLSRFAPETLRSHLTVSPGLSLWVPRTSEYLIGEAWRRRADIAHIVECHARRGKNALVNALVGKARDLGYSLVVLSDEVWNQSPRVYESMGFGHIERIVFYQKDLRGPVSGDSPSDPPVVTVRRAGWGDIDLLLRLDHESFPWLWWNSRPEFEEYLSISGVSAFLANEDDEPVGYASFSMYNGWAHLDRLAVVSSRQGRRLGAAELVFVLEEMRSLGARSVALSTQQSNTRSHALYRRFGFVQTREQMNFYGLPLAEEPRQVEPNNWTAPAL